MAAARRLKTEAEQLHQAALEAERTAKSRAKQEAREVLAGLRQKLKDLSRTLAVDKATVSQERQEVEALAQKLEPAEEAPPLAQQAVPTQRCAPGSPPWCSRRPS